MQLLARLMDHVLAARRERRTHRRRDLRRYRRRGGRSVSRPRPCRPDRSVPRRPHLRRAAPHDDDGRRRPTSTRVAVDGTFDDCQAIVKGMFNHHAFRDRVSLSGVNSINWARIVAQAVYYFTAAVSLGAPQRKIAFTVPTGNFGDVYRRLRRLAHGAAGRPAGHRDQRQRHSRPDARHRHVRTARCGADHLAVDGHPGFVEFRTAAVRRLSPRRRRHTDLDGAARAIGAVYAVGVRLVRHSRAVSPPAAPTRRRSPRPSAPCCARPAVSSIRTRRSALPSPRRSRATRRCRWWCCRPRIRPSSPMRWRRPAGSGPRCPHGFPISMRRPERVTVLPADQAAVERFVLAASRAAQEGAAA